MKGKFFLLMAILLALVAVLAQFWPLDRTPPEVQIQPAPGGSQVVVTWSDVGLTPLIEAVPGWLDAGRHDCGD